MSPRPTHSGMRMRTTRYPVSRVRLYVGDRIKLREERLRYTVRAVSADGRWAIATKPFNPRRTVLYTIVDFDSAVRGPDNYGGLGYETPDQIADVMARLEVGDAEVSVRYDLRLDIESVDRDASVHEVGEGGWVVRRTHDVEYAAQLLWDHLVAERLVDDRDQAKAQWPAERGHAVWTRIVPALPNSWAEAEGYAFHYQPAEPHARGAFRAVEWWS